MNKINFKNPQDLFQHAAHHFFTQANIALEHKAFFDVALSGGSTAQNFFPYLLAGDHTLLNKTRWFFSDERAVNLTSEHSNAGLAWRLLLDPIKLHRTQFFPIFDGAHVAPEGAVHYEALLKTHLPLNNQEVPVFDLVYLGMGQDGHTASLFPGSDLIKNIELNPALVCATKETKLEHERITMMPRLILAAKEICLLTTGKEKNSLMEKILEDNYRPEQWPVQLIIKHQPQNLQILTTD